MSRAIRGALYVRKAVPFKGNRRYWPTRWQIPLGPLPSLAQGRSFELGGVA